MRVIAGSARRLRLKTLEGMETRPTQDIIKETLFNVIQMEVPGSRFLDLFAGSGAIGIEALSRGALEAVFVENNKKAVKIINDNLDFTKLKDRGEVLSGDCLTALSGLESGFKMKVSRGFHGRGRFDIIHMDPPYEKGLEKDILSFLSDSPLLHEDTLIITEASVNTGFDYAEELGYQLVKEKIYKHNKHVFLKHKGKAVQDDQ